MLRLRSTSAYPLACIHVLLVLTCSSTGWHTRCKPLHVRHCELVHTMQARYEIWTQDAFHSAIYASCSSPGSLNAQALTSFASSRQTWLNRTVDPNGTRTTAYGQYLGLQEALLQCLPEGARSDQSPEAARYTLSQQPATVRLKSSQQPLTLPSGLGGGGGGGGGTPTGSSNSAAAAFADGFYYAAPGDSDEEPTVRELLLRPGAPFDVSVQLYDAVGLPVIAGEWLNRICLTTYAQRVGRRPKGAPWLELASQAHAGGEATCGIMVHSPSTLQARTLRPYPRSMAQLPATERGSCCRHPACFRRYGSCGHHSCHPARACAQWCSAYSERHLQPHQYHPAGTLAVQCLHGSPGPRPHRGPQPQAARSGRHRCVEAGGGAGMAGAVPPALHGSGERAAGGTRAGGVPARETALWCYKRHPLTLHMVH